MAEFGRSMREHFLLEPADGVFINHGSYGAAPKSVYGEKLRLLAEMESQPDMWCRKKIFDYWTKNRDQVSEFVGSDPENLTFVSNATSGINTVLKSLDLNPGDGILTFTYTYKAIRNTCIYTARRTGAEVLTLDFRTPISSVDQVVELYENFIKEHPNIKVVVIDYISSVPSVKMPLDRLLPLFRKHNIISVVDGAHCPGQVKLNLEELGADFFTGNLHKWLFANRGCAILWISPKYHNVTRPLVTSGWLDHSIMMDFLWQGTVDHTNYFSSAAGVDFVNDVIGGQDAYIKYCSELADKAADLLVKKFGTEKFQIPKEMESPFLKMIKMPPMPGMEYPEEDRSDPATSFGDVPLIPQFWEKYKIQSVFLYVHGEPWVRISCNIYNTIEDYEKFADCYLDMIKEKSQ